MIFKILKFSLIGLILLLIAAAGWFSYEFRRLPSHPQEAVIFTVERGSDVRSISKALVRQGVMQKEWPFFLGYRLFHSSDTLKAGEYSFDLPLSPRQILEKILEGKVTLYPVTVREGLTRRETADHMNLTLHLEKKDFLEAASETGLISELDPQAKNLEGYLFPETYHFPRRTTVETIVGTMVAQFKDVFSPQWSRRAAELGMSIREVVTLASLIEKETSAADEKPIVSGVFHNRLRIGMKLDCDPTIIYALKEEGIFDGNLRKRDMTWDNPYNTYMYAGLPPGPIANPGRDSIEAALYPADVDYFYFVSKNDGTHHFSRTFREHLNAVDHYQKKRN